MSPGTTVALALGVIFVALTIAAVVWWINRSSAGTRAGAGLDLPLYSVTLPPMGDAPSASAPMLTAIPTAPRPSAPPPVAAPSRPGKKRSASRPAPSPPQADAPASARPTAPADGARAPTIREFETSSLPPRTVTNPSSPPVAPTQAHDTPPRAITAHGVPGTEIEGHLLRFSVPQEGTLQFLPGRLEITGGVDAAREIRFVRVPGPDGTTVTFGRSEGPAYRHIQLREATVSRAHARMHLDDGRWHLTNLSITNPVVYNGRVLREGEEQLLSDGDRIEMGEVAFGFRSR